MKYFEKTSSIKTELYKKVKPTALNFINARKKGELLGLIGKVENKMTDTERMELESILKSSKGWNKNRQGLIDNVNRNMEVLDNSWGKLR